LGLQQHSTWFPCCMRYNATWCTVYAGKGPARLCSLACEWSCGIHGTAARPSNAALGGHKALFAGACTHHISIGKRHPLRLIKCTPIQVDSMYRRPPPTMTMPRPCITAVHGNLNTS
jgi:hypothetical protein